LFGHRGVVRRRRDCAIGGRPHHRTHAPGRAANCRSSGVHFNWKPYRSVSPVCSTTGRSITPLCIQVAKSG
jgi:hypothetical protein